MSVAVPENRPRSALPAVLVVTSLAAVALGVASGVSTIGTTTLAVLVTIAAATRVTSISWTKLIGVLILIIMLVPIRRYSLPGQLPFQLELYRVFVGFLVLGWFASLLVDSRTTFRRTGFEGPLLVIVGAAFASVLANPDRVNATSSASS